MTKIIEIDGKQVPFKANAVTVIKYRKRYGRDLMIDFRKMTEAGNRGETLSTDILTMFMDFAYIMAKQADESLPDDPMDWLEQFEVFPFDILMPELVDLWRLSNLPTAELQKKAKA